MTIYSAVFIQYQRVTDRQTDRLTDGQTDGRPAYIYYRTCFSIADARKIVRRQLLPCPFLGPCLRKCLYMYLAFLLAIICRLIDERRQLNAPEFSPTNDTISPLCRRTRSQCIAADCHSHTEESRTTTCLIVELTRPLSPAPSVNYARYVRLLRYIRTICRVNREWRSVVQHMKMMLLYSRKCATDPESTFHKVMVNSVWW